jgi:hypothetical protein
MERSDVGTDEEARGQGFTFIGLEVRARRWQMRIMECVWASREGKCYCMCVPCGRPLASIIILRHAAPMVQLLWLVYEGKAGGVQGVGVHDRYGKECAHKRRWEKMWVWRGARD